MRGVAHQHWPARPLSASTPMPGDGLETLRLAQHQAALAGLPLTIASPRGCSLPAPPRRPGAAARFIRPPARWTESTSTSVTAGWPRVIVPVLSSTTSLDLAGPLQRLAGFEQDAQLGALPGAHHHRGGSGQAHRARAGDYQHGHHLDRAPVNWLTSEFTGSRTKKYQPRKVSSGNHDHSRHKDRRDLVGQLLDRGFARPALLPPGG